MQHQKLFLKPEANPACGLFAWRNPMASRGARSGGKKPAKKETAKKPAPAKATKADKGGY
jgi:hypothetical protein